MTKIDFPVAARMLSGSVLLLRVDVDWHPLGDSAAADHENSQLVRVSYGIFVQFATSGFLA